MFRNYFHYSAFLITSVYAHRKPKIELNQTFFPWKIFIYQPYTLFTLSFRSNEQQFEFRLLLFIRRYTFSFRLLLSVTHLLLFLFFFSLSRVLCDFTHHTLLKLSLGKEKKKNDSFHSLLRRLLLPFLSLIGRLLLEMASFPSRTNACAHVQPGNGRVCADHFLFSFSYFVSYFCNNYPLFFFFFYTFVIPYCFLSFIFSTVIFSLFLFLFLSYNQKLILFSFIIYFSFSVTYPVLFCFFPSYLFVFSFIYPGSHFILCFLSFHFLFISLSLFL
ncbi:SOAT [Acanthosepion pharaonis]|uniref:SOAT n=1 Tax=Acanthosepion pharaonis TaxID=158019 RepID=A0A812BRF9_ACAPH|nr:SOAT [Sepia pharaonis]